MPKLVGHRPQTENNSSKQKNVFTASIFGEDMKVWVNPFKLVSFQLPRWVIENDMSLQEFVGVFGDLACSNGLTLADNLPRVDK